MAIHTLKSSAGAIPLNAQCLDRTTGTSSKQGTPNLRVLMQLSAPIQNPRCYVGRHRKLDLIIE